MLSFAFNVGTANAAEKQLRNNIDATECLRSAARESYIAKQNAGQINKKFR